jgi:hypothetical protein
MDLVRKSIETELLPFHKKKNLKHMNRFRLLKYMYFMKKFIRKDSNKVYDSVIDKLLILKQYRRLKCSIA